MTKRKKTLKKIPSFRSEADERKFWETHNSTEYVDWTRAQVARFPRLRPSTESISLRLPAPLLEDLRSLANKRDVPYQSLLKELLAERLADELRKTAPHPRGRRVRRLGHPAKPRAVGK